MVLLNNFVETDTFFTRFFDEHKVQKNSIYLIEILWNINAFLLKNFIN